MATYGCFDATPLWGIDVEYNDGALMGGHDRMTSPRTGAMVAVGHVDDLPSVELVENNDGMLMGGHDGTASPRTGIIMIVGCVDDLPAVQSVIWRNKGGSIAMVEVPSGE